MRVWGTDSDAYTTEIECRPVGGCGDGAGLGCRIPRKHGHDGRGARHRARSRSGHGRSAVAPQRLPASAQRADPARWLARRPVRPSPGVRRRTDRLRDRLRAVHGRAGLRTLLACRLLQGIFGALLVPNSLAILDTLFTEEDRGAAIGQWAAWSGVSTALGPLVGGWLVDALSWRWVFACVVPFAFAAAWVAAPKNARGRAVWRGSRGLRRGGVGHARPGGCHGCVRGGPEPRRDGRRGRGRRRGPRPPGCLRSGRTPRP